MVALKTFINLPDERKEEIIQASLTEFAINDYQSASLSNIIKVLGLAKGSFYRYFENKQSLYYYLLDYCVQKRVENDNTVITTPPEDFFDLILLHLKAKLQLTNVTRWQVHSSTEHLGKKTAKSWEISNIVANRWLWRYLRSFWTNI